MKKKDDDKKPNQDRAAIFCAKEKIKNPEEYLSGLIKKCDEGRDDEKYKKSGSTFCGAVISGGKVTVGNLGDSRTFAVMKNEDGKVALVSLSEDFDPQTQRFREEIEADGGGVAFGRSGDCRIVYKEKAMLATAGAIGDKGFTGVIKEADFFEYDLQNIAKSFTNDEVLEGFSCQGILITSDAFMKIPSLFEVCDENGKIVSSSYESWAPRDVMVFDMEADGDNDDKELILQRNSGSPNMLKEGENFSAKAFVDFVRENNGPVGGQNCDDNTALYVELSEIKEGENILAIVGDGHGKFGHEFSSSIIEEIQKDKNMEIVNWNIAFLPSAVVGGGGAVSKDGSSWTHSI